MSRKKQEQESEIRKPKKHPATHGPPSDFGAWFVDDDNSVWQRINNGEMIPGTTRPTPGLTEREFDRNQTEVDVQKRTNRLNNYLNKKFPELLLKTINHSNKKRYKKYKDRIEPGWIVHLDSVWGIYLHPPRSGPQYIGAFEHYNALGEIRRNGDFFSEDSPSTEDEAILLEFTKLS